MYDSDNSGVASTTPDTDGDGEYDFRDTDDEVSLPVELLNFEASPLTNKVALKWSTATEVNNNYFVIERSVNGKLWEEIIR